MVRTGFHYISIAYRLPITLPSDERREFEKASLIPLRFILCRTFNEEFSGDLREIAVSMPAKAETWNFSDLKASLYISFSIV